MEKGFAFYKHGLRAMFLDKALQKLRTIARTHWPVLAHSKWMIRSCFLGGNKWKLLRPTRRTEIKKIKCDNVGQCSNEINCVFWWCSGVGHSVIFGLWFWVWRVFGMGIWSEVGSVECDVVSASVEFTGHVRCVACDVCSAVCCVRPSELICFVEYEEGHVK